MSREDDPNVTAGDPDIEHLIDLLRMLPGPKDNPKFWAGIGSEGRSIEPSGKNLDYVFEKMTHLSRFLDDPTPKRLVHLCVYLLHFFSGDRPDLWKILNDVTPSESRWGHDDTGRWWAEDLTHTAWSLIVRYCDYGDESWRNRWYYERSWLEWLPPRDEKTSPDCES